MKLTKLSLAMASALGAGIAADAMALDLYVDTKTQQIFAEPGKGRVKLGSFEKVEDTVAKKAEADAQKAEINQIKEDLALKTNEMKALDEHMKAAEETKVSLNTKDGGLGIESKDGNFKMKIIGRLQADAQTNISNEDGLTGTQPLSDAAGIRRARIGVEGTFYKDFAYKFEYDFSGAGVTNAGITDAYINYTGLKDFGFQVGQFKEPYGMEIQTSNRFIPFIERSMMSNAFSDANGSYQTGFGVSYNQPRWGTKVALQTSPTQGGWGQPQNNNVHQGDTTWQIAARLFGTPWMEDKTHLWHVGASGSYRDANAAGNTFNIRSAMGGNIDRTPPFTYTTPAAGSTYPTSISRAGIETALVYGPWAAMGEYTRLHLDGSHFDSNAKGEAMEGYYGYATYMITGESRAYKSSTGAWDRVIPKSNFNLNGGWGAWELAVGYDALNLADGTSISAGRAQLGKVGVNWYLNPRIKFMTNLVHVLDISSPTTTYNNKDMDMVEFRGQVDF